MFYVKLSILNVSQDFFEEFSFLHSFLFPWCILLHFWLFQWVTVLSAHWLWNVVSRFVAIWFSESHLKFSNLSPYAGQSSLASVDWRITPVLLWRKVHTEKSSWSDWHQTILPCPCITSKLCAKVWAGQSSQNSRTSDSIEWYPRIHRVRVLSACFGKYSWLKNGSTH